MKKTLLCLITLAATCSFRSAAQGTITLTTNAPVGTKVEFLPNTVSAMSPIEVDWGNGIKQKYTVDPNTSAWQRWIEGTIEGTTLTISGYLTELSFSEAQLTSASVTGMSNLTTLELDKNELSSFELLDITPLKTLNLGYNKIANTPSENATLSLEQAAKTLTSLTVSHNENLQCLKIDQLVNLEYLTLNDCPDLASIFICLPEESRPLLRSIDLRNCALSNFYPVSLPGLRTLDLSNNNLMTGQYTDSPFVLGDYPELTDLNISGNPHIDALDISKCTKLEKLRIANCNFTQINTGNCPDLQTFIASDNKIGSFDLGNNKSLTNLNVSGNPVKELDIEDFTSLQSINFSNTEISRVNLMKLYYLKTFDAENTPLEFIDFNGQQPYRMERINLRNCSGFTTESLSYTLWTLPQAKSSYNAAPNLLLEGLPYDGADFTWAMASDMNWKTDVEYTSATADWATVNVTLTGATDTGENKTGTVDRLYPLMGYSMDYDLDVMQTAGGKFILAQWQRPNFQTVASVLDKAIKGVPMYVYAYPDEEKRFKSVTVNGKEISSPWFMLTEDATVEVNFTDSESSISVTVPSGQPMSFLVNTACENGTVWVDWGTGSRSEYTGQRKYDNTADLYGTRIEGASNGTTVTLYGDITGVDFSGFGDMAELFGLWDNRISAIDLSKAPELEYLNVYWNPITSIDLSGATKLKVLNISYTALKTVDLSHNSDLLWLEAYSDGFGDEEEGIALLTSLDVSNMPYLQYLDCKRNAITSLDLSNCGWLGYLDCNGNEISSLDVAKCTKLEELNCSDNKIAAIDVSMLPDLVDLNVEGNLLTSIDLSDNTELRTLSIGNNDIHSFDASALTKLQSLYINGNGMTAEELNRVYYKLPIRVEENTDQQPGVGQTTWNLAVIQSLDKNPNDANRADSSIAEDRQWSVSHTGTNGGSTWSYLDIFTPVNGKVEIKDADGNVYTNGSEVEKYKPLTIVATPDEGYAYSSFSLNGETPSEGTEFEMPGIYTKLTCNFALKSAIDEVSVSGLMAASARGVIIVKAPAEAAAKVYTTSGVLAAEVGFTTATTISVPAGIYVVEVSTADSKSLTTKVIVK